MARRHLGTNIDQWEALPWWQRQVYMEGLEEEFGERDDESYIDDEFDDDLGAAVSLGVQVRNVS